MGVKKVDRNGPMVLDSQAIWMICSRLDVSMNQRSAATTFKAQLVTETPAIEKDKKSVFENDRSPMVPLGEFVSFQHALPAHEISVSILSPQKLEAQMRKASGHRMQMRSIVQGRLPGDKNPRVEFSKAVLLPPDLFDNLSEVLQVCVKCAPVRAELHKVKFTARMQVWFNVHKQLPSEQVCQVDRQDRAVSWEVPWYTALSKPKDVEVVQVPKYGKLCQVHAVLRTAQVTSKDVATLTGILRVGVPLPLAADTGLCEKTCLKVSELLLAPTLLLGVQVPHVRFKNATLPWTEQHKLKVQVVLKAEWKKPSSEKTPGQVVLKDDWKKQVSVKNQADKFRSSFLKFSLPLASGTPDFKAKEIVLHGVEFAAGQPVGLGLITKVGLLGAPCIEWWDLQPTCVLPLRSEKVKVDTFWIFRQAWPKPKVVPKAPEAEVPNDPPIQVGLQNQVTIEIPKERRASSRNHALTQRWWKIEAVNVVMELEGTTGPLAAVLGVEFLSESFSEVLQLCTKCMPLQTETKVELKVSWSRIQVWCDVQAHLLSDKVSFGKHSRSPKQVRETTYPSMSPVDSRCSRWLSRSTIAKHLELQSAVQAPKFQWSPIRMRKSKIVKAPVLGADHVADHGLCQSRLKCKIFAEATKCQPCFVTEKQKAEGKLKVRVHLRLQAWWEVRGHLLPKQVMLKDDRGRHGQERVPFLLGLKKFEDPSMLAVKKFEDPSKDAETNRLIRPVLEALARDPREGVTVAPFEPIIRSVGFCRGKLAETSTRKVPEVRIKTLLRIPIEQHRRVKGQLVLKEDRKKQVSFKNQGKGVSSFLTFSLLSVSLNIAHADFKLKVKEWVPSWLGLKTLEEPSKDAGANCSTRHVGRPLPLAADTGLCERARLRLTPALAQVPQVRLKTLLLVPTEEHTRVKVEVSLRQERKKPPLLNYQGHGVCSFLKFSTSSTSRSIADDSKEPLQDAGATRETRHAAVIDTKSSLGVWSRRFKASGMESDSPLCGPLLPEPRDILSLNASSPTEDLIREDGTHKSSALQEEVDERAELRDVKDGCRTLLGHSKKRFAFRDDDETELDETPPPRRAPRRHFLCEAEKRGGTQLLLLSGGVFHGQEAMTLPGIELAGWQHEGISQMDVGHHLALLHPFSSVLIATGHVLQQKEPEELVLLSLSHGGNTCYTLASSIERSLSRSVRGVVMWDFISAFGRISVRGLSSFEADVDRRSSLATWLMQLWLQTMTSSPAFKSRPHAISMVAGARSGEIASDQRLELQDNDAWVKVLWSNLDIREVDCGHMEYEQSTWDIQRLILSTRPAEPTAP